MLIIFLGIFIIVVVLLTTTIKISNDNTPCILNDYFDKVVCISTPKRKNSMSRILNIWNVDYEFYDAYLKTDYDENALVKEGFIDSECSLNKGRVCCHYSHMQVLKEFIDDPEAKTLLVFEDDMEFTYNNVKQLNKILEPFLKSLPHDWNYLNLGPCYEECSKTTSENTHWRNAYKTVCRNAIAFSKSGARIVYRNCKPMVDNAGDAMIAQLIMYNKLPRAYISTGQLFKQNRALFSSNLGNYQSLRICSEKDYDPEKLNV